MFLMCGDQITSLGSSKPPKGTTIIEAFIRGAWSDNEEDEVGKTKDETCLVAQAPDEICLGVNLEPDEWIKDSGCSKHMTGFSPSSDPKSYEGVFLGYLAKSKSYIILNKQTMKVEESLNVTFDETPLPPKTSPLEDDELVEEEAIEVSGIETIMYADSDHAGDYVDRKSTMVSCNVYEMLLTSSVFKKQTALAISTTESKRNTEAPGKGMSTSHQWIKQAHHRLWR
ncbi:hypothetical protein Tco_0484737 [Tanacetum coccineum]